MKLTETKEFKELVTIQNDPSNWNKDILTIVGFMKSIDELKTHLEFYKNQQEKRQTSQDWPKIKRTYSHKGSWL